MMFLNQIGILKKKESKSLLTTSFVLLYNMNFISLLFEWITRSPSTCLEEIKLIAIVN